MEVDRDGYYRFNVQCPECGEKLSTSMSRRDPHTTDSAGPNFCKNCGNDDLAYIKESPVPDGVDADYYWKRRAEDRKKWASDSER